MIFFLMAIQLRAQDVSGDWFGILDVGIAQLELVFHITQSDTGYTATMDSPDQNALGIPVSKVTFLPPELKMDVTNLGIFYEGSLKSDTIVGTFRQAGRDFPLDLYRDRIEKKVQVRPQEPIPPFPYYSEEVSFPNPEFDISLAGTLTLPDTNGIYPVAVLISGSGPQNRDEELLGHKPFLVLADFLTRNGIGVLRYDDRGVGQSTGDHEAANSADLATDAKSAVRYLKTRKEIDPDKIGLIGHSEGGLIAPMVATGSDDIAFLVLMAGPGIRGDSILLIQQALIARAGGASDGAIDTMRRINSEIFELVNRITDPDQLKKQLKQYISRAITEGEVGDIPEGVSKADYETMMIHSITSPWMQFFLRYDPSQALEKVRCPVLAINGEKDLQVTPDENLTAIAAALKRGGNKNVTTMELAGLNHLFQESETGSPNEYSSIEQTFSPHALNVILEWLQSHME